MLHVCRDVKAQQATVSIGDTKIGGAPLNGHRSGRTACALATDGLRCCEGREERARRGQRYSWDAVWDGCQPMDAEAVEARSAGLAAGQHARDPPCFT